MKLIINGNVYEYPQWNVHDSKGELRIATNEDFAALTTLFNVEPGSEIVQKDDNDIDMGIWYVNGLESIQINSEGAYRIAVITYVISTLPVDIKNELEDSINEGYDASIELAEFLTELENALKRSEDGMVSRDERIDNAEEIIEHLRSTVEGFESRLNGIADRVAALENKQ